MQESYLASYARVSLPAMMNHIHRSFWTWRITHSHFDFLSKQKRPQCLFFNHTMCSITGLEVSSGLNENWKNWGLWVRNFIIRFNSSLVYRYPRFSKVFIMPLHFYERPELEPVFAKGKKKVQRGFLLLQGKAKSKNK